MQISPGFAGLLSFVYVFLCIRTCKSMNRVDEIFHDWAWRFLDQNYKKCWSKLKNAFPLAGAPVQISPGFAGLLDFVHVFLCIRTCKSMNGVDKIFHDWAWRFLNQNDKSAGVNSKMPSP